MKLIRSLTRRRPDITRRVLPDHSGREIEDLRQYYGHELRTAVYFYADKLVLAAPTTGTPFNIHAELRPPLVAEEPVSDEQLGYMALQALLMLDATPVPSLRDAKLTDWTTCKASRAPSVKAFSRDSIRVALETVYGLVRVEASPLIPDNSVFAVRAWASTCASHEEFGQIMRKVVRGAKVLQEAGVV